MFELRLRCYSIRPVPVTHLSANKRGVIIRETDTLILIDLEMLPSPGAPIMLQVDVGREVYEVGAADDRTASPDERCYGQGRAFTEPGPERTHDRHISDENNFVNNNNTPVYFDQHGSVSLGTQDNLTYS